MNATSSPRSPRQKTVALRPEAYERLHRLADRNGRKLGDTVERLITLAEAVEVLR